MNIQRVGVVGAGTMGNGIAHVFARGGYGVVLCDVEQRFLDRGLETIGKNLDREVAKNKITVEDKAAALKRIEPVVERAKLTLTLMNRFPYSSGSVLVAPRRHAADLRGLTPEECKQYFDSGTCPKLP